MTHQHIPYEEILHEAGYRVTRQRVLILDAICAGEGHSSIGEIYARARRWDAAIDKSTVYRTVALFEEVGLVFSAEMDEKRYEIASPQPHHHLVCRVCGHTEEIGHDVVQSMLDLLESRHGFRADLDHLVIEGVCGACV